ncbi:MAG: M48 family metalloprotease [Armatimonadetes bacterium]|nr:M48 family metalloprotease [Armatimonadota bacterium]
MNRRSAVRVALIPWVCLGVALALTSGCDDKVEKQIGSLTASSVEKEYAVVSDPLISEWLNTAGQTMVGHSTRQSIPYSFKVIDTDMVNAFAAPYGYIYVTTGLLDFADTEDEIWGVVGHEIGHVVHRHGISQAKKSFLYNIGLAILGNSNQTLADIAGMGLGLLSLRYSRENEYEADDMGRKLSFGAGYDPAGNTAFFSKLMDKYEKRRPSSIEVMFRTHPPTERRIARQNAMPELSASNAESLLLTGRGYARRHQVRRAEGLLARAAELSPNDPTTLLALAEVQYARGKYDQAAQTYAAAGSLRPTEFARHGVQLAQAGGPPALAMASSSGQAKAAALASVATGSASQAGIVVARTAQRDDTIATSLAPTVTGAHSIIDSLFGLAETSPELPDLAQKAVTYANAAVNQAIEPLYSLERQREKLRQSAQDARDCSARLVAKLNLAKAGRIPAQDIPVLERTLNENNRLLADISTALDQFDAARPAVIEAEKSARETTKLIERVMRGDTSPAVTQAVEKSAQVSQSKALAALAATSKAKRTSEQAALRALVARINTAAVGAPANVRENLDGLVAHVMLDQPRAVRQMRVQGLGYGDVALLVAASHKKPQEPGALVASALRASSMVDHVSNIGAQSDGALYLMKYLANALEYETEE